MVPWCDRLGRLPRRSSCRMDNQNGNVQNAKTVEFLVSAASCCDARLRNRLLCLSGHDLFPTIILCVHPFSGSKHIIFFLISERYPAHIWNIGKATVCLHWRGHKHLYAKPCSKEKPSKLYRKNVASCSKREATVQVTWAECTSFKDFTAK